MGCHVFICMYGSSLFFLSYGWSLRKKLISVHIYRLAKVYFVYYHLRLVEAKKVHMLYNQFFWKTRLNRWLTSLRNVWIYVRRCWLAEIYFVYNYLRSGFSYIKILLYNFRGGTQLSSHVIKPFLKKFESLT
jgi:hypothetical protein